MEKPILGAAAVNSDLGTLALALSTPVIVATALVGLALTFSHPIGQVAMATALVSAAIILFIRYLVRRNS